MAEEKHPRLLPLEAPTAASTPAPRLALTEPQKGMYAAVLDKIAALEAVACSPKHADKSGPLTDVERAWLSRDCLLRYLRACKWSVSQAVERIAATLAWRREYDVEGFTADYISPEQETGKQLPVGFDRQGRPCHYLNPGRQNTHASPRQVHHLVYMVERVIDVMPTGVENLSLMINYRQTKSKYQQGVPLAMAKEVLNILQNHYPERLGKCLIINVHWMIQGFFKIITPFIDPVTREKLKFNEDMTQYVPPEQLWAFDWGGQLEFEYDHDVFWPAFIGMCKKNKDERFARWEAAGKHIGESEDYMAGGTDESVFGFKWGAKVEAEVVKEEVTEDVRKEVEEVRGEVREQVIEEVREEVTQEVREEITQEVREEITHEVREEVREEVKEEVQQEAKVEQKVEETVEVKKEEQVEQQAAGRVEERIEEKVEEKVGEKVETMTQTTTETMTQTTTETKVEEKVEHKPEGNVIAQLAGLNLGNGSAWK